MKMNVQLVAIATLIVLSATKNTTLIDYYLKLITEHSISALNYQFPVNNVEFQVDPKKPKGNWKMSYDFIIVGAGSSGAVLAKRLSEIKDWNVLLLEAGGYENDFNEIPGMMPLVQFSEMNWGYYSTPQTTCCQGMRDNRCIYPRGKVLGGSSSINALLYVRGNALDFDRWEELGNPGWSYKKVLPYFKKSENSQINGDADYHGEGGLWNVAYSVPSNPTLENFLRANQELGKNLADYNGVNQNDGASIFQTSTKNGRRQSTARAFLKPAEKQKNLKIITKAYVTKVLMVNKTATGVVFTNNGREFVVRATKEMIISAGAVNSPQLLMLSGVGPQDHLKKLGIKVIENLPVGKYLQDHPTFYGLTFRTNYTVTNNNMVELIQQYLAGFGLLSSPGNSAGIGFNNNGASYPMTEYIYVPSNSTGAISPRMYNFNDNLVTNYLNRINPMTDVRLYVVLLHQKSLGSITLKSRNPLDFPNIHLRYFSDPKNLDLENMYQGIQTVMKLMKTKAFREIDATFLDFPVCNNQKKFSRKYWYCAIRQMTATIYHPTGTTRMGSDPKVSVVDPNLKVHGIKNLRVVDCGVFPDTLSGHPNAVAVMVAEKIADTIKQDHNQYCS